MKWGKILTKEYLLEEYPLDKKNKSMQEIGIEKNCNSNIVFYYLKKYNIQIKIKSEALKGHKGYWTGKEFSEQMKQKIKDSKKGKKRKPFSKEWKQNMSESKIGENHPNFKGRIKNSQGYILIYSPVKLKRIYFLNQKT